MTRFVVISQPRTGTHLVRTTLEQHDDVRCAWEPFNDKAVEHFSYGIDVGHAEILRQIWESGTQTCGFVVHWLHGRSPRAWDGLWETLRRDDELRIVHLWRRDLLAQHLSHRRALMSNAWLEMDSDPLAGRVPTPMQLSLRELALALTELQGRVSDQLSFRSSDALFVQYESLSDDLQPEADRIFEYLGLRSVPVRAITRKMAGAVEAELVNGESMAQAIEVEGLRYFRAPQC